MLLYWDLRRDKKIVYIALGKRGYVEWRRLKLGEKEKLCKDGMTYTHTKN
jgi:hypothetical protein